MQGTLKNPKDPSGTVSSPKELPALIIWKEPESPMMKKLTTRDALGSAVHLSTWHPLLNKINFFTAIKRPKILHVHTLITYGQKLLEKN